MLPSEELPNDLSGEQTLYSTFNSFVRDLDINATAELTTNCSHI